ncbi:hypothetical protein [Sulfurimonas sp.]
MLTKKNMALSIFETLKVDEKLHDFSQNREESVDKKEYESLVKSVVKDFPLFLRQSGTTIKIRRSEINSDLEKLLIKLDLYYNHKTYYTDRLKSASSKTKYPFSCASYEKNSINLAMVEAEDRVDFVGNAANSQYYKVIARLISNNGRYLKNDYNIEDFPIDFQNRITKVEKWFIDIFKRNSVDKIHIDNSTTQILFPLGNSYISVSPAESMALLNTLMQSTKAFNNTYFEQKKKIEQQLLKLTNVNSKIRSKKVKKVKDFVSDDENLLVERLCDEDKKEVATLKNNNVSFQERSLFIDNCLSIYELQKQRERLVFVKTTKWQSMIGKPQNVSLKTPASKSGFLYAEMPNFDAIAMEKFMLQSPLFDYVQRNIKNLFFKQQTFKKLVMSANDNFSLFSDQEKDMNIRDKDKSKRDVLNLFKYFLSQKNIKDDLMQKCLENDEDSSYSKKLTPCIEEIARAFLNITLSLRKNLVLSEFATEHYVEFLTLEGEKYV